MTKPSAFFVFGCQRSGTTIAMEVFERSPSIEVYPEMDPRANHRNFQYKTMQDVRLRSKEEIAALIAASKRQVVLFKPLMDCHYADQILDRHDGKGFWLYRNYHDVAHSSVVKWGAHQKDMVNAIYHDSWGELGWRVERLSQDTLRKIKSCWRPDLTEHEGGALYWYMRNQFFLERGFAQDPRFLLVRYESMVVKPASVFGKMFEFMGVPFDASFVHDVNTNSIRNAGRVLQPSKITEMCDGLLTHLDGLVGAHS